MWCPKCKGKTLVTQTEKIADSVCRVRKCQRCGYVFGTEEMESRDARIKLCDVHNKEAAVYRARKRFERKALHEWAKKGGAE